MKEENIAFARCALSNDFPMDNPEAAAIRWCKKLVNGVLDIFPKLPVHIRIHKESFQSFKGTSAFKIALKWQGVAKKI